MALVSGVGLAFGAGGVAAGDAPTPVAASAQIDISRAINDIAAQQTERVRLDAAPPVAAVAGPDPHSLGCLTEAVYYEARGESDAGQAAVAQVVLNRVGRPHFAASVCGVVFQGARTHSCQFSFACHPEPSRHREPAAWSRARAVAARAMAGYVMPAVGYATYFHVAKLGAVWGSHMTPVARVGHHLFYEPGGRRQLARAYNLLRAQSQVAAAAASPRASAAVEAAQPTSAVRAEPAPVHAASSAS